MAPPAHVQQVFLPYAEKSILNNYFAVTLHILAVSYPLAYGVGCPADCPVDFGGGTIHTHDIFIFHSWIFILPKLLINSFVVESS